MKIRNFFFLCFFTPFIIHANIDEKNLYDYYIKMGDSLYQYHDFHANFNKATEYYQKAYQLDSEKQQAYWRIARNLWVEQEKITDPKQKRAILKEAQLFVQTAAQKFPKNVDIRLWKAIIDGSYLLYSNFLQSLLFLANSVKEDLEFVIIQRPESARALCALGLYYFLNPVALGGDEQKSIEFLKRTLQVDPQFHRARLYLARVYLKRGEIEQAKQTLLFILKSKNATENAFLFTFQTRAKELLNRLENG